MTFSFIVGLLSALIGTTSASIPYDVPYNWNTINFTWPSEDAYNSAIKNYSYIPENNGLAGIKVWKDKVYVTVPRWMKGTPVTLASISIASTSNIKSPLLEPYPSWDMQKLDDCSALQFVMSMEIDPKGRMWIIDNGRIHFIDGDSKAVCPAKLVVIDLENNEVLWSYEFPDDVVHMKTVFINDIVVDHEDGGWAYITDVDSDFPGMIVFSAQNKKSWKIFHESMAVQENATKLTVNGTTINAKSPVNGIALSGASVGAGKRRVYYNPLSSFNLYSVPTSVLKQALTDIGNHVDNEGEKVSQSSGMMMSAKGILYFSQLSNDAMCSWDTKLVPFNSSYKIIIQDHENSQYPDSIAVDENNQLWYVSNRIQNLMSAKKYDISQVNFRVIRANIGSKNYQYLEDGTVPEGL